MSENERRGERSQERTSSPVRLNYSSGVVKLFISCCRFKG